LRDPVVSGCVRLGEEFDSLLPLPIAFGAVATRHFNSCSAPVVGVEFPQCDAARYLFQAGSSVRTYTPKPGDIKREWHVIDAEGLILGRLSTEVATLLRGKHKAMWAPHVDTGDHVVIVNAEKLSITPKKLKDKMYHRHSGYPGGLTSENLQTLLGRDPERVLKLAVKGMLPKGRLGRQMIKKLRVYAGPTHPHQAQAPKPHALPTRSATAS